MAQSNTFDSLNALFKQVYADKIENLIPDGVKLMKEITFAQKAKLGNAYNQPVILGLEHGVTFASSDEDAFDLNAAVAGVVKNAQVQGNPIVLSSVLGYKAAASAIGGDSKSFMDATKFLVANMVRSMAKKLEVTMFYGGSGYGTVASVATNTITITTAEYAAGIWSGGENMPLEIRSADGVTSRGTCNVVSVNLDNRSITVDALPGGTVATDVIWHLSAFGNEFLGIHAILSNASTIFGINAATYSLWKSSTYAVGGQLSLGKIESAISKAVAKGLDSDVSVLVSPSTWKDLLAEQTAFRQFDSSYSSAELEAGSKSLKFYGQNGIVKIEPTIYCKEGYAYIVDMTSFMRIGSTDVTFKRPGMEGEFFRDLDAKAGYELRALSDQALFCEAPGRQVLLTGIVNAA